jgi:hypothetical protein
MSELLCTLCNRELTESPDASDEGFWAVTVDDSGNPGVARAHPVHTTCMKETYPELFDLVRQEISEVGSTG